MTLQRFLTAKGATPTLPRVTGFAAPGFYQVEQLFCENWLAGEEENAAFCAFVDGELRVNLRGTVDDDAREDELQVVYSCTKNAEALVIGMLVDRGLLDYSTKIAAVWPEFAQNGKGDITVGDVMRHQAGLPYFESPLSARDLIYHDWEAIGQHIARQRPVLSPVKDGQAYHAITRGLILQQLLLRLTGSGINDFLQREVCSRLGIDFSIGLGRRDGHSMVLDESLRKRVRMLKSPSPGAVAAATLEGEGRQAFEACTQGRAVYDHTKDGIPQQWIEALTSTGTHTAKAMAFRGNNVVPFAIVPENEQEQEQFLCMELSSSNGVTNAPSMAVMAHILSTGKAPIDLPKVSKLLSQEALTEALNTTFLSETTLAKMRANSRPVDSPYDQVLCVDSPPLCDGGVARFQAPAAMSPYGETRAGWGGLGGQSLTWTEASEKAPVVAAAFCTTQMGVAPGSSGPRAARLVNAAITLACERKAVNDAAAAVRAPSN
ncbi:MAG: hypothetical protein MHM6MM_007209 [Cercozoa sp. M6MM]